MLVMKALRQDVAILAFHPHDALRGLKAHGTALSFVPPKTFCYSRRTRRAPKALHRTKKIGLYFRGVAAFRSNQRYSASKLRSEEHTSELQSRGHLVCRLLLEQRNDV